ncbi:MAG TPA: tetratricopeptide repeat protein [Kofleriaceae bacterium]|nr:tetratricopeptide repeat protein [Kofleriaceae bacterium]
MWSSYSARQAAQLIGLPESAVRACIRSGLVGQGGDVPAKLTFRDLAALRTVKSLVDGGVPPARARRELTLIVRQMPPGTSITNLPLEARAGHVHVRGIVGPATGPQLELPLDITPPPPGELHPIPPREAPPAPALAPAVTADEWLARALALEETDPPAAIDAYRRCLRLRPDSTEGWINLGRLYAEGSDPTAARECFVTALRLDPADATALYNLGVVAQDAGSESEAIDLYTRALELDPTLAEAHYNLATLFDQSGDARAAIRHINEYRKLTK